MLNPLDTASVYTDFQGLSRLRSHVRDESPEALRTVAQQFEALFTQMMLKNMRDASLGDDLFGSDQSRMYQDMFDKQISLSLSEKRGMGLADMLVRQLTRDQPSSTGVDNEPVPINKVMRNDVAITSPQQFVNILYPIAQESGKKLGADPEVLLSQAALETGWGKAIIKNRDGSSSHNLFGIKADAKWKGNSVSSNTLEYVDGVAVRHIEKFRSYDSYAESFEDYIKFLQDKPRYGDAINNAHEPRAFTQALQDAGYATDPDYANKINAIRSGSLLQKTLAAYKVSFSDSGKAPLI